MIFFQADAGVNPSLVYLEVSSCERFTPTLPVPFGDSFVSFPQACDAIRTC
jgi:hypothetical protein